MLAGHGLDLALLMLRVAAGGFLLPHALGKLFGWFGGPGLAGFATELRGFGLPAVAPLPLLLSLLQVLSGLAVLLGWQTRIAALAAAAFIGFTALLAVPRAGSGCAVAVSTRGCGPRCCWPSRWPGPATGRWTANTFREISLEPRSLDHGRRNVVLASGAAVALGLAGRAGAALDSTSRSVA